MDEETVPDASAETDSPAVEIRIINRDRQPAAYSNHVNIVIEHAANMAFISFAQLGAFTVEQSEPDPATGTRIIPAYPVARIVMPVAKLQALVDGLVGSYQDLFGELPEHIEEEAES